MFDTYALRNNDITYLENAMLDENKNLKILPYSFYKDISQNDISLFCVKHGYYNIPTIELIECLKKEIGNKADKTIEIGSGNGVMAKALGIKATDSFMQEREDIKALYEASMQTPVKYGDNVLNYDGNEAVKIFKPQIVVAAWVTHKFNPYEAWREGNEVGVDEEKIFKKVKKYIFIGNENTHNKKPIMKYSHSIVKPEWLISRSMHKDKNFIAVWKGV